MATQPAKGPVLIIIPGSTLTQTFQYKTKTSVDSNAATGVDLTNYTVSAAAKIVPDEETLPDPNAGVDLVFTVTKATPQTGANAGKFTLSLTSTQTTDALNLHSQDALFRFDISLQPSNGDTIVPLFGFLRFYSAISPVN